MDLPSIEGAIEYAMEAHRGDFRDGAHALPYITHPIEVLCLLRYVGQVSDEEMLCAAALHDVLEETSISPFALESKFGPGVAKLVQELTREEPNVEGLSKDDIYEKRTEILLREIAAMSPRAKVIKLADRLANLRQARVTKTQKKLRRYLVQTENILQLIPRHLNDCLWDAISSEIDLCKRRVGATIIEVPNGTK